MHAGESTWIMGVHFARECTCRSWECTGKQDLHFGDKRVVGCMRVNLDHGSTLIIIMQESALADHGSALAWMWRVHFNFNSTLRSLQEDYKQVISYYINMTMSKVHTQTTNSA